MKMSEPPKEEKTPASFKWPAVPSATTFGSAPVVNSTDGRKAYTVWILARLAYECFRWGCWTLMVSKIASLMMGETLDLALLP